MTSNPNTDNPLGQRSGWLIVWVDPFGISLLAFLIFLSGLSKPVDSVFSTVFPYHPLEPASTGEDLPLQKGLFVPNPSFQDT